MSLLWRIPFTNVSNIETLLEKSSLELEELLEEDELLQEIKAHNSKLIDLYAFIICGCSNFMQSFAQGKSPEAASVVDN